MPPSNEYPGGLRPDLPADFYLLAILDELRAMRQLLEQGAASPAPAPAAAPKTPRARKAAV